MGIVPKTTIIRYGSKGMVRVLQHRLGLSETIILYVIHRRTVKGFFKITQIRGCRHTGYSM